MWPSNPTPGTHPEETIRQKVTRTPVFVAVLFAILKTWKQPECSPMAEWIKKTWYKYTISVYTTYYGILVIEGRRRRGRQRMGNTCTVMVDSCQYMAKTTNVK